MAENEVDAARDARVIRLSVDVFVTLVVIVAFGWFSMSIVAPFVPILLWSIVLAVALHPLYLGLVAKLGGREGRAALIMGLVGVLLLLVPAGMIGGSVIESLGELARRLVDDQIAVPAPSEAVKDWFLIGEPLYNLWSSSHADLERTIAHFGPQLREAAGSALAAGAGVAGGVLQFALSIVFAAVFLRFWQPLAEAVGNLAGRAASQRGRLMLRMSALTIQSVSRGVLGVAVIQGFLGGLGVIVMGLPFAGFIAAALIMLCIVQLPPLGFLPVIGLAWYLEPGVGATIFTIYMIAVMFIDNVLKPMLLGRGLTTPMPVILIGVIGGTFTSGLLGLFIGPVILAIFWEMMRVWSSDSDDMAGLEAETAAREAENAAIAGASG
ncbi:MAG: AI-2E family transporter [Pseudomonadota bacterium]